MRVPLYTPKYYLAPIIGGPLKQGPLIFANPQMGLSTPSGGALGGASTSPHELQSIMKATVRMDIGLYMELSSKLGVLLRSPCDKDPGILGSNLGPLSIGNSHVAS